MTIIPTSLSLPLEFALLENRITVLAVAVVVVVGQHCCWEWTQGLQDLTPDAEQVFYRPAIVLPFKLIYLPPRVNGYVFFFLATSDRRALKHTALPRY